MKIVAQYSFKDGAAFLEQNHGAELEEIRQIISEVDATACRTKVSEEKTMPGKILYSPIDLNKQFERLFAARGWKTVRIKVATTVLETGRTHRGFREMDWVKNGVGVEVQFGKYAFMVYNVAAKMTIFANQGIIDCGIEVVPMLTLANEMSSGVSYFEQMKTDLEMRGESDIDIPALILGIDVGRPRAVQETLVQYRA